MLIKVIKLSQIFKTHKDVVENQQEFLHELRVNINNYSKLVDLDLKDVTVNSSMATLLVSIHLIFDYSDRKARLINVDAITETLLKVTSIDEHFEIIKKGDDDGKDKRIL